MQRLGGPNSRSAHFAGEKKSLLPQLGIQTRYLCYPSRSPVTIPTGPPLLLLGTNVSEKNTAFIIRAQFRNVRYTEEVVRFFVLLPPKYRPPRTSLHDVITRPTKNNAIKSDNKPPDKFLVVESSLCPYYNRTGTSEMTKIFHSSLQQ
jgi:hypothetical protein